MYYVYEFYIINTGEIIYAGKGKGNRYKVKSQRNKLLTEMLKRFECNSRIIKKFGTEKEAFDFEYDYIKSLKEKGQCVCNIYSGGAGGSGEYWTDELREEYSKNNVMKSEKQRKRMREHNPMSNPEIAEKTNSQKRKAVIIGNREYPSIKDACKSLNVDSGTITLWCKKGINRKGEKCRYKGKEQVIFKDKRYNKGSCKPIMYKDIEYETPIDIAKELKINVSIVYRWAKNGFDDYGNVCRYTNDTRELKFERKKGQRHTIIVNGKHYKSISEAGRILGVTQQYIGDILRGKIKSKKYICKYDNQQPSTNLKDL